MVDALASDSANANVGNETVWAHTRTADPEVFESIENFDGFNWIVVSDQSVESALAPISGLDDLNDSFGRSGSNLLMLTFGVLLLAGLVAFFSAQFLARSIVSPIRRLTLAAYEAANISLPAAVEGIGADGVDAATAKAPSVAVDTGDELEELAGSFNQVQDSAVRLASEQALSRRNMLEMFLNLGRRNQSLLKRQLRFIDDLERDETDPDTLESLFRLDHLATRMRRNAESLLAVSYTHLTLPTTPYV